MDNPFSRVKPVSELNLVAATVAFIIFFQNGTFFSKLLEVYGFGSGHNLFLASVVLVTLALTWMLMALTCWARGTRPGLVVWLLLSSGTRYVTTRYGIAIDADMIQNGAETNAGELTDLLNLDMAGFFLVWWVLPAAVIILLPLKKRSVVKELLARGKSVSIAFGVILVCVLPLSRDYASFLREHKPLRYYVNPVHTFYSMTRYVSKMVKPAPKKPISVGDDAVIPEEDMNRELIILVVGETARADHFSLNGYPRETNPLLKDDGVISFTQMTSCGTSTAVSLPCMFSYYTKDQDGDEKANRAENALDVLRKAGVEILWRDNNSSSKGVADRVAFEDFRTPEVNPECDVECRDIGMLAGLESYIKEVPGGDILIILHQMGSHGPAYYKRYPEGFGVFEPACQSAELGDCEDEQIINAYDNTILYTDYFLHQVIQFLRGYDETFETALFYISDHGESLGEKGIYLHGMPYPLAPDAQTHVAAMMWLGQHFITEEDEVRAWSDRPLTHDVLFHTLLSMFEVETSVYDPNLSIMPIESRLEPHQTLDSEPGN